MKSSTNHQKRYILELDQFGSSYSTNTPRFASRQSGNLKKIYKADRVLGGKCEKEQLNNDICFSFDKNTQDCGLKKHHQKVSGQVNQLYSNQNNTKITFQQISSLQYEQTNSVNSFQSLRQRLKSRSAGKKIRQIKQIVKNIQCKTTSNLTNFKCDSPAHKKDTQAKKQLSETNSNSKEKPTKKYYKNESESKQQKLRLFANPDQNCKLELQTKLKADKREQYVEEANMFEKGRSLKSLLMRTKPILQIKNRLLSNQKLQNFRQTVQSFQQCI